MLIVKYLSVDMVTAGLDVSTSLIIRASKYSLKHERLVSFLRAYLIIFKEVIDRMYRALQASIAVGRVP